MPEINPALMLKHKKQTQAAVSASVYKRYSDEQYVQKYRLKSMTSGKYLKGEYTFDQCLKMMRAELLALYVMEPVKKG